MNIEIKNILYLDLITDLEYDCVNVIITLISNKAYLVEVTTAKFFYTLIKKYKSDFVPAGFPYTIVSKLTDKIMRSAVQEFINAEENLY